MLFKLSHWISGKVRNHLYKERNDRKTGQCFEPINSFRDKNLKLKTGVLQEIRNDFLIGGKGNFYVSVGYNLEFFPKQYIINDTLETRMMK